MANKNANQNIEIDNIETDIDFEEVEVLLSKQLEDSFYELELLENDRESILGLPSSLISISYRNLFEISGVNSNTHTC